MITIFYQERGYCFNSYLYKLSIQHQDQLRQEQNETVASL